MKSKMGHVGLNLPEDSFPFLKDLLGYLEFSLDLDDGSHFHSSDGRTYLCVTATKPDYLTLAYHRKHTGLNHLAFQVSSADHVDQFVTEFLVPRGIAALYGGAQTPPGYPEDYYAVYFEDPSRVKFEVVSEGRS